MAHTEARDLSIKGCIWMTADVAPMPSRATVSNVVIQLALVTLMIASFVWIIRPAFRGSTPAFVVLLAVVLIWSHRKRGDSLRELGFRLDTAPRTALLFAPVALVIASAALAAGAWMGTLRFPPFDYSLHQLSDLIPFGIAQQYVLLAFYYRGIASLVHTPGRAVLLAALVFSAFHVPNVFLIVTTFLAGLIAAAIYRRSPNLWVNGITHGLISFTLGYTVPLSVTHNLRVGPGYWTFVAP
jgi:membrane protease YdiL (CAAX protease family)